VPIRSQQELSNEYLVEKNRRQSSRERSSQSSFTIHATGFNFHRTAPVPPFEDRKTSLCSSASDFARAAGAAERCAGGAGRASSWWQPCSKHYGLAARQLRTHTHTHIFFFTKQIFVFFFVARKLFLSPTLMARVCAVSQRSEVPSRFLVWQRRFLILRLNHVLVGQAKPKRTSVH
jgi:hypothetical protein